jgi:hypothetical protein
MNNLKLGQTQTRKVGTAGSLQNQLQGNNSTIPKVGEGATMLYYSDREAYEVISVSEDNTKCTIRELDSKKIGEGYGDERYSYSSNTKNQTMDLEYNFKRKSWCSVTYSIEVIKSLQNKLEKKYGWENWTNYLPNGINFKSLINKEQEYDRNRWLHLVDGVTKEYKNYNNISIIFGFAEKYRDPHF